MIKDGQVRTLFRLLDMGLPLTKAARKTDMDEKTARKYRQARQLPSERIPLLLFKSGSFVRIRDLHLTDAKVLNLLNRTDVFILQAGPWDTRAFQRTCEDFISQLTRRFSCRLFRRFDSSGYLPKLDEEIEALKQRAKDAGNTDTDDPEDIARRLQSMERRVAEMKILRQLVKDVLDLSPEKTAGKGAVLDGAKGLLEKHARTASKMDSYAHLRLVEDIGNLRCWLADDKGLALDAWDWLTALPANTTILGSGPQPGRLHVASLSSGGHSGRSNTFIVGLDDSRFPGAGLQDPLFLDGERRAVSPDLPTATGNLEEKIQDFHRLLARLRGKLSLSYSCHDLSDNREKFPSPLLMAAYRIVSGNHEGTQEDLLKWMPMPVSFAPTTENSCLNTTEWWLWRLCAGGEVRDAEDLVGNAFPHLVRGKQAADKRQSDDFTEYDGHVPEAGKKLDPTAAKGPVMSSSRLETLGSCPMKFFFQRALGIDPPDELVVEPDRWLDPLAYGKLLHSVFERFVRELVEAGLPAKYPEDMKRLNAILDELVKE